MQDWSGLGKVWTLALAIGLARVAAVWFYVLITAPSSNWLQVLGYILVLVALPEAYLVRNLRGEPYVWGAVLTALLLLGSFLWTLLGVRLLQRWRGSAAHLRGK